MSEQKEEGWYKIKFKREWTYGYRFKPKYTNDYFPWKVFGYERWFRDEDFDEIGEKINMPE